MAKYNKDNSAAKFSGLSGATTSSARRYFTDGKYKAKILEFVDGTTRDGKDFVAAKFEIIESNNEDFKPGDEVSWFNYIPGKDGIGLGNLKGFLMAALGCKEDEIEDNDAVEAVSEEQPLVDAVVNAMAVTIQTKAGADFTAVNFSAVQ